MTLTEALAKHTPRLMQLPGVVGSGEGTKDGKPCIFIFLLEANDRLPRSLEGFDVVSRVVGDVQALDENPPPG